MTKNKKGFTLIELIIVVMLIGVLAVLAAPMAQSMKARAIATEAEMGLSAMAASLQQYYAENGAYPPVSFDYDNIQNYAQYFPGLTIRQGAYGTSPATLDGQYFSQEDYFYRYPGSQPPPEPSHRRVFTVLRTYGSFAPKGNEILNLLDDAQKAHDNGSFISFYVTVGSFDSSRSKKFMQMYFSKSGLPQDPWQGWWQ